MHLRLFLGLSLLATPALCAEPLAEIPLWSEGAPGALGTEAKDKPTLTPYLPEAGTGSRAAIVVCP